MDTNPPSDPLRDLSAPRPGTRRSRRRSSGPGFPIWPVALLLVVAAGFAWWWFAGRTPGEPAGGFADAGVRDTAGAADAGALADAPPEPLELPPLAGSDAFIQGVVAELSAHPRWAAWLATDAVVSRFVSAVAALAAGTSPREHVPFMVPEQPFQARSAGEGLTIDPASYARYDAFTAAVTGLDRNGTVRLYQQLHPLFEEAYAELGLPPENFDADVARAMDQLLAVPVPDGPVAVRQHEAVYEFVDPALESRTPAEKHMLRLGPENAIRVQGKLRQLRAALVAAGVLPPAGG